MKRRAFFTMILCVTLLFSGICMAQTREPVRGKMRGPIRGMGRGPEQGASRVVRQRNIDSCIDALDLSSDQITKTRKIREEHRENLGKIQEKMGDYREQQRKYMHENTTIDQKVFEELLNQGSVIWKEEEKERLIFRQKITEILTQEQKDALYECENSGPKQRVKKQQGRSATPRLK